MIPPEVGDLHLVVFGNEIGKPKKDLIDKYPKQAQVIESLLVEFNDKQSDPLFPSAFEAPIMIDKYDGQEYEVGDEYIYWSN